jgi:uncharacterized membrane protein YvbJ
LVYCTKCGTENPDDAVTCSNCGASLQPPAYRYSRRDWDRDDECFGGRSSTTWPLLIGVFIILVGLSSLLERTYYWARFDNLWPIFIIALGLIILYNTLQKR